MKKVIALGFALVVAVIFAATAIARPAAPAGAAAFSCTGPTIGIDCAVDRRGRRSSARSS